MARKSCNGDAKLEGASWVQSVLYVPLANDKTTNPYKKIENLAYTLISANLKNMIFKF